MRDYLFKHLREIVALHPRLEALETPIDIQKSNETDWRGNPYTRQTIVER
jgi:hypothetical protein